MPLSGMVDMKDTLMMKGGVLVVLSGSGTPHDATMRGIPFCYEFLLSSFIKAI